MSTGVALGVFALVAALFHPIMRVRLLAAPAIGLLREADAAARVA